MPLDKMYRDLELQDLKETLDFESKLIFMIMRKSAHEGFGEPITFGKFKRQYKTEIKATAQVLEWLGLAKCDDTAPLGWRSTISLQHAFVYRGYTSEDLLRLPSKEEDRLFEEMYRAALGKQEEDDTTIFVTRQLVGFCLAQNCADDHYIPTDPLKRFFRQAKARRSLSNKQLVS
jgi:hypothetical protein